MKGIAKKAVSYVEDRGYTFDRQNGRGIRFYRSGAGHEVGIQQCVDEHGFRAIRQTVDRACGVGPDLSQKRHPDQIKARQERERFLLAEERARHRERLDALLRQKQEVALGGLGRHLTERQIKDIERLIEAEIAAHRETVRAMTCVPSGAV